jgi:branched-chain amino acid transport system ATP-binding protein
VPISADDSALEIAGLRAGYGKIGVLHGVDLRVGRAEVVALLGPNGAGKTTLLRTISGLLPTTAGEIVSVGEPCGAPTRAPWCAPDSRT